MADQGPLPQEEQAEVGSAREGLEEAHSPFREIHPSFHDLCYLSICNIQCGVFAHVGKYSCTWVRAKVLAPSHRFYSQPVQDEWENSFAQAALKLLSQMEAAGIAGEEIQHSIRQCHQPRAVPSMEL